MQVLVKWRSSAVLRRPGGGSSRLGGGGGGGGKDISSILNRYWCCYIPVNILTLGLFTLVINALLVMLAARIVPGFEVRSFMTAFWFGVVLSIVNWFLNKVD
jgi:hypothetical protein